MLKGVKKGDILEALLFCIVIAALIYHTAVKEYFNG